MEPFEKDELPDRELDAILKQWRAPQAPARLREAVLGDRPESCVPQSWWTRLWHASIRVPAPVACALLVAAVLTVWLWPRHAAAPVTVVKTVRVEVPVIQEHQVIQEVTKIVYRDREPQSPPVWRPVTELQPIIIHNTSEEPK